MLFQLSYAPVLTEGVGPSASGYQPDALPVAPCQDEQKRKDSNLQITVLGTIAVPLSHAPIYEGEWT